MAANVISASNPLVVAFLKLYLFSSKRQVGWLAFSGLENVRLSYRKLSLSSPSMSSRNTARSEWSNFRYRCYRIIFHSDKFYEKLFDVVLIGAIVMSVGAVMLESVEGIRANHGALLYRLEWLFTILFSAEYALRLYVARRPLRYMRSFFGMVDLLSILPTFLDLIFPGARYLMLFRALRVLRIFRILKMVQYVGEANLLYRALRASGRKIIVFTFSVVTLVAILGSIMYLVEGPEHGFTSIPKGVYWAIVTLTTVGYGDISPQTPMGQAVASVVMIIGYGIIAVPTGIVTAEIALATREQRRTRRCSSCPEIDHMPDARFCRSCGSGLD